VTFDTVAGGMEFVVERDVDARREPLVRGRPDREREVRRSVARRLVEPALCPGDGDRRVHVGQDVERERGVCECVRTVRDDDAVGGGGHILVSFYTAFVSFYIALADRVAHGRCGREHVAPPHVESGL